MRETERRVVGQEEGRRAAGRHPDIEVARLLVRRGWVSKAKALEALKVQKQRARGGKARVAFLKLLTAQGALDPGQLEEARDEIQRHTYLCERCDARTVILAGSEQRASACPRCGSEIQVEPPSEGGEEGRGEFAESETDPWRGGRRALDLDRDQRVFGRYVVREELGRGAMGVVYRAEDVQRGGEVALKVMLPTEGDRENQVARFRREAGAVQKLDHPGVIRLFDFGHEGELHYLTMELVEGGRSLHQVLRDRSAPWTLRRRVEALAEVARAVGHAHERGVVHRDLKPANVLVDPSGRPRVADFGLAKDEDDVDGADLTRTHDRLGTPLFMAPEQIRRGKAPLDHRADVWALGVMLFVCATGRYPFRSRTLMDLYLRVLKEPPDWTGTRYSAPDRVGLGGSVSAPNFDRSESSSAEIPPATILGSDEHTEVCRGEDGELPRRLPERALKRQPPPFAPPRDAAELPRDLRRVIECALAKDPADRYPTAEAFAEDLERHLSGEGALGGGPGLWKRVRQRMTRKRVLVPLSVTLGVAVVLLGGLSLVLLVRAQQREARRQVREDLEALWRDTAQRGAFDEAERALTAALTRLGDPPVGRVLRGKARLWRLDLHGARDDLEDAEARGEAEVVGQAAQLRVWVELAAGRPEAAVEAGRRAWAATGSRDPVSAVRWVEAAVASGSEGEEEAARAAVEECLRESSAGSRPQRLESYAVWLRVRAGELDEARRALPEESATEPWGWALARAAVAQASGEEGLTERCFERALREWRQGPGGEVQRFWALGGEVEDPERALVALRLVAGMTPFHPEAQLRLGRLLLTQFARPRAALPWLERAWALERGNEGARDLVLAVLGAEPSALGRASEAWERARRERPEAADPLLGGAVVAARMRRWEEVDESLRRLGVRVPGARDRAGLLQAAWLRLTGGDEARATAWERRYRGSELEQVWDRCEVARLYLEAGETARAWALVQEAQRVGAPGEGPRARRVWASLHVIAARAAASQALHEQAEEYLKRAVQSDPLPPEASPEALRGCRELEVLATRPGFREVLEDLDARSDRALP